MFFLVEGYLGMCSLAVVGLFRCDFCGCAGNWL